MNRIETEFIINNETEIVYQPIIKVDNAEIIGAEALTRVVKEDGTLSSPIKLLEAADKFGLLHLIDSKVISDSTAFSKKALKVKPGFKFSVNITYDTMVRKQYELERTGVIKWQTKENKPNFIYEINEHQALEKNVLNLLDYIAKTGTSVAIDDFGVGYSEIHKMKSKAIEYVKLDMKLLPKDTSDIFEINVFKGIISMFKVMGKKIVVEGVETEAQLEMLKDIGGLYAQGFYLQKPMRAKDLLELLKR